MTALVDLLGPKLQGKAGEVDTAAALDGKTVGLYFSAHWCPPCRGFTPKLASAYTDTFKAKNLEVVFISSDRDKGAFDEYYGEMPWLALPYDARDLKNKISAKYKVKGIPSFVILDSAGKTITTDGRSKIMEDPTGDDFPWAPKPWAEVIGDTFLKGDQTVGKEAIAGKTLLLYFSAHWCPPCRGFTPKLAQHYKAYKEKGLAVEAIFVSGDRDEESFKDYYKEMQAGGGDWLSIPFDDKKRNAQLNGLFEVEGIPTLVVVDENGNVINKNARGAVGNDPSGEGFPWAPPLVVDMAMPEGIDEAVSVCVFMEAVPPAQQMQIASEMDTVAKKYKDEAKATGDDPKYLFFSAKNSDGPVPQIRQITGLPPASSNATVNIKGEQSPVGLVRSISNELASQATMLILNLEDNGAFYKSDELEITADTIANFIKAYEDKTVERQQCKRPGE